MEIRVSDLIKEVLEKENISIHELAGRLRTEPWQLDRKLQDDKDMRSLGWVEIAAAIGYQVKMVPRNPNKDTVVLDMDNNAPLKVLNRIMVFSEVKRADIIKELGITRQAMSQILRKNSDILANRFVQISDIIGYDIVMTKQQPAVVK